MQPAKSLTPSIALADIFPPEAVVIGVETRTKQGVVAELVHHLVTTGQISADKEEAIVQGIMVREQSVGATGFNGIAYPHCQLSLMDKFIGAVGLDPPGFLFDVVDGDPVFAIFLLLAPLERRDQLYEVLGRLTALGRDKTLRLQLHGCTTGEAVHCFLQSVDRR